MGFWKSFGRGLKRVAPIAVALTPTPMDDIAYGIGTQIASDPAKQRLALRLAIAEAVRRINPTLSAEALEATADAVARLFEKSE